MSTQYAFPKIVTNGLFWAFDVADSGSYFSGSSTLNNLTPSSIISGSLVNSPGFDPANQGSILFDGVNDAITFPTGSTDLSTADFSIEFWFYRTGTSQTYARYIQFANGDVFSAASITINSNNQDQILSSVSSTGTSWNIHSTVVGTFNSGSWNQFVMSRNGTSINYYVNGALSFATSSISATLYYTATQVPIVGGQTVGTARTVAGRIPIIRVYKGAFLDAVGVKQNYDAQKVRFGLT